MRVVSQRMPRRETDHCITAVGTEAVHYAVVVAGEARPARVVDGDGAMKRVVVVQDIVGHGVVGGAGIDIHAPTAVRRGDDRIVDDGVAAGARGGVNLIEADTAGVVVIEQVVANHAVGDTIHVDAGAAASAVAVNDVAF